MTQTQPAIINDREGLAPNEVEWAFILDQFANPFERHEVKLREQSRGQFAAYIDSRTLQGRLDKVVGANWETNFRELATRNTLIIPKTPSDAQEKARVAFQNAENERRLASSVYIPLEFVVPAIERANNYGKVKNKSDEVSEYQDIYTTGVHCDLLVYGKARSDVGTPANTEPVKSAYSDSLKRAAVQWGIGRYLYSLGFFASPNAELPEDALPAEEINFAGLVNSERTKIKELLSNYAGSDKEQVAIEFELVNSRYSPLVSVVQKRRVFMNLKEITVYLEKAGK